MTQPTVRRILKCVIALAGVVVVGLGPALPTVAVEDSASSAAAAPQGSSSVMIMDDKYHPASLEVTVGDTVTWTNQTQAQHGVAGTSGPEALQAPLLSQGQSWSHAFGTAGSYSYLCSVHPDMVASITVNPSDELATAPADTTEPTTGLPPLAVAGVVVAIVLGTTLALFGSGAVDAPAAETE